MTPAAVLVPVSLLLLVLPPGLLLRRHAGVSDLGLVGAAVLGIGWASLVALLAGFVGLPLLAAGVAILGSALASAALLWRAKEPIVAAPTRPDVVVVLLGLGIAAVAAWQGPWLSHGADVFYHLGAVRSVLMKGESFPTLPLYADVASWPDPTSSGLHTLLALVSAATGVDPVAGWRTLHPLAAALPAVALARFAWRVVGRAIAAPLAVAIQLVAFGGLDLRSAAYPGHLGMALFWTVLALALAPVGPALLAIAVAGLAAVHVGLATAALVAVAVVAGLRWLADGPRCAARLLPGLFVGVLVVAARSAPIGLSATTADPRVGAPAYPTNLPTFGGLIGGPVLGALAGDMAALVTPAIAATAVALVAGALWLRWRGPRLGLGLAAAGSLAPLAAALALAPVPASMAYAVGRTGAVLAALYPILLAWALLESLRRPRWLGAVVVAALLVPIGREAAASTGRLLAPDAPGGHSLAASRAGDLSVAWRDRVAALATLPAGAVLFAHPETGYQLAGLAGVFVAATPRSHTPVAVERAGGWLRRGDALDLIDLSAEPERLASIAERMPGDGYLLVDATSPTWPTWRDRPPSSFARLAAGPDWALFRYEFSGLRGLVDVPLENQASAIGWGIRPVEPLAGEVAFVRLDGAPPGASLTLVDQARGGVVASASVAAELTPLHVPIGTPIGWYRLAIVDAGGGTAELGTVSVGHEYGAESFPVPYVRDPSSAPGTWALYEQGFFGRHHAARAWEPSAAVRPIPSLPPGRYSVRARIYEYVYAVPNQIEVRFGGVVVGLSWASGSEAPRVVSNEVTTVSPADRLELAAVRREQPLIVVDWLRVYPGGRPPA